MVILTATLVSGDALSRFDAETESSLQFQRLQSKHFLFTCSKVIIFGFCTGPWTWDIFHCFLIFSTKQEIGRIIDRE